MAGILDQIGVDPGATPAPEPAAAGGNEQLIVRGIASGQLPGAYIPESAPKSEANVSPEDLSAQGVSLYRPQTPGIAAVMFNSEVVPIEKIKELDASGTLTKTFPSVTDLMAGPSAEAGATPEAPAEAAEPAQQPSAVPVLPRPTFGGAAARKVSTARLAALGGGVEPSKRLIPGGGSVLNGLVQRAV